MLLFFSVAVAAAAAAAAIVSTATVPMWLFYSSNYYTFLSSYLTAVLLLEPTSNSQLFCDLLYNAASISHYVAFTG
jgi:hypothetical protein